jgi:outer membrane protein TolC
LGPQIRNIDLDTALRLAGVRNPELMIARQRITEAAAIRQYAAAQLLPNINAGKNFDATAVKRLMPTKVKIS